MRPSADICKAAIIAAAMVLACSGAQAQDKPDATITFSGGNVAFLAGVNWGGGTLRYQGKDIPVRVSGLSVGAVGASSFNASGTVYNLKQVSDIEGTYAAGAASATVVAGAGIAEMQNGKGVVIKMTESSNGLHLKLGPSGVTIALKK